MKCDICEEKVTCCEGCNEKFEKGDSIICDSFTRSHYCSIDCSGDLEEGAVI